MTESHINGRARQKLLESIDGRHFDVAIIGGGISGAGVANDAAQRGMKVLLLEADDFASGASSKSSRLLHGGFRYLETGQLGLVREAAQERDVMHHIAPHLARPVDFVLPAESRRRLLFYRAGIRLYEQLGAVNRAHRHAYWGVDELIAAMPMLRPNDIRGAFVYREYLTEDARLTMANLRSAHVQGATLVNYAPVSALTERKDGLVFNDALTTENPNLRITAGVIVNCGGAWVDQVRAMESTARPRLVLSKGIHIAVAHHKLPLKQVLAFRSTDQRYLFAVPSHGMTYIGTTDGLYPCPSRDPEVTAAEVDYLLASTNAQLSTPVLAANDVVSAWAGLRPLVAQSARKTASLARRDEIWTGPGGMITVAGGKLTAYRKMAERVTDLLEDRLDRRHQPCRTAETVLPGGDLLTGEATGRLAQLYGSETPSVLARARDPFEAEVIWAIEAEGAQQLTDVWLRRTLAGRYPCETSASLLGNCADILARAYNWSHSYREAQIQACLHAMNPITGKPTAQP